MERLLSVLRVLGVPLLLMGLALGGYAVFTLVTDAFGDFRETDARVEARRTEQRRATGHRGASYDVTVTLLTLSFEANGEAQRVERRVPANTPTGRAQVGAQVRIFYLAGDPTDVRLQRPSPTHGLVLLVGAAFLTAAGMVGTRALLLRRRP